MRRRPWSAIRIFMSNPSEDFSRDPTQMLSDPRVVLAFSGLLDQRILVSLSESLSNRLAALNVSEDRAHAVHEVLVEQVQNVLHHGDPGAGGPAAGMCLVLRDGDLGFEVSTGNFVSKPRFRELEQFVEELNGMTPEQLTGRFHATGKQGRMRSDGSSRLGLLQMARKSRSPLRVSGRAFTDDATRYYYILTVQV